MCIRDRPRHDRRATCRRAGRLGADGEPPMSATTAPVGPAPSLPSAVSLGLARVGLGLRVYFRERRAVVCNFAYPVIMLAIFAAVFGKSGVKVGPAPWFPYSQWFLPGIVATGLILLSFQK